MNIVGVFSGWTVDKKITGGDIMAMIGGALTAVLFIGTIMFYQDRRIEDVTSNSKVNTRDISDLKTGQAETNRKIEALRLEQKEDLNRLDGKLDDIRNLIIQQGK